MSCLKSHDKFGRPFSLKMDAGVGSSIKTYMGTCCTFLCFLIVAVYTAEKVFALIDKKNVNSLNQVKDMGLRSKADLQTTKNKLTETSGEIETLNRLIQDKSAQIENQRKTIEELKKTW